MSFHEEEVLGKAYDARLMRRLLTYLWPHRTVVLVALCAILAHSLLQLVPPYLIKIVIDDYIPTGNISGLGTIAVLFLSMLIGSFILEYIETWTLQLTGQKIMFSLRMQVYTHLQRLDLRFYNRNPVGRLMTRVTTDVDVLNDLFTSGVVSVFGDVFTLMGIMAVLLWMDWRLAIVAFSVLPIIVLITQWFRRHVRNSYRKVRTRIAQINAFLQERITGMATVQLFTREKKDYALFEKIDGSHRDANLESIFYYAVFYPAIELVSALAASLILWYGGGLVIRDALTLGSLVAFFQYSQRFFRPISDLSEKFNTLQAAMASSERIFALLDVPVVIQNPQQPLRRRVNDPGHIVFSHVTFGYTPNEPVIRDVSFEVKPGERIGIVGATGAGKSTLINLLLRFYDVQQGQIMIDGVDTRDMDLRELRGLYSLVLQDINLFSGTIAGNVRLGNSDISDEMVWRAIQAVHAEEFVSRLPLGIETAVAEGGATLSVGQKQLLSFARALAFDPQVLILDEATSSIDTETELLIRDALHVLMRGRTTLAVAHRLSTIQDMDRILVLHKGQLRESGTHQELLALKGIYYRLYRLQFKQDETPAFGLSISHPATASS